MNRGRAVDGSLVYTYTHRRPQQSAMQHLGFIGSGVMASALMGGLNRTGLFTPDHMLASDPRKHNAATLQKMGIPATIDNVEVVNKSDIIIIAVKPNVCII